MYYKNSTYTSLGHSMSFSPLFGVAQGIYTGQVEKQLIDAWNWVTHFKNAVYPAAFQVFSG
jgi:hypothetical protein